MEKIYRIILMVLLVPTLSMGQQKLWTTSLSGGVANPSATGSYGTVRVYDPSTNSFTTYWAFVKAEGTSPCGAPLMASNGKLYGTTNANGANDAGTIWRINTNVANSFDIIHHFNSSTGSYAHGNFMQAANGKVYGVTEQNGANGKGTIIEIDISTDAVTKVYDFTTANGYSAFGKMVEAAPGKLLGTTRLGGTNSNGVIFEFDYTTGIYTKKIDFASGSTGSEPWEGMIKWTNGKFYGMTKLGGSSNLGVLYEYDYATNTITVKQNLTLSTGSKPSGALTLAENGLLYGLTMEGGTNSVGTLFSYNPGTNTFSRLFTFAAAISGSNPTGNLTESNGKLYGTTRYGGASNGGTVFEYDYASGTFTNKVNLSTGTTSVKDLFMSSFAVQNCSAVTINTQPVNDTICTSGTAAFSVAATGTGLTYQWQVKTGGGGYSNVSNNATYSGVTTSTLSVAATSSLDGYFYRCVITSGTTCSEYSGSAKLVVNANPSVTPAVSIAVTSGNSTMCAGSSITFTATPTNEGSSPLYQWKVDGASVGTNSTTYTSSSLTDGAEVSCVLTSNASCANTTTATSSAITMDVTPTVTPAISISITSGSSSGCAGSNVEFTASATNQGSSPSYQWKVNGGNVGTSSTTFSSTTLSSGDVISCELTSNASCATSATATSSGITMSISSQVTPAVSINVTSGSSTMCAGSSITFKAFPTNQGSSPSYQWKVDGANVGTNSEMFSSTSLTDGQQVTCELTSSVGCVTSPTAASNSITMNVTANVSPSVLIAVTSGSNTICAGDAVTFEATATNGGSGVSYQWKVGSTNVGSNSDTYTSTSLADDDIVTCVITSSITCVTSSTATSTGISMNVTNAFTASALADGGSSATVCENSSVTLSSNSINGATYSWTGPNGYTAGSQNPTVASITTAQAGTYMVTITAGSCSSQASVTVSVNANPAAPLITADLNAMTLTSNKTSGNQWYFEGVQMFGETGQVVNMFFEGSYTVTYHDGNCTSESTPYVYSVSTGVSKTMLSDKIQVYPNPSDGLVNVSFNGKEEASITVKDIYGIILYTGKINGKISEIDLSAFESGIYFVNVKSGGEEGVVKLVVE